MFFIYPEKMYVSGDCYHGNPKKLYGFLTILAHDFGDIKAGYYLSNEAQCPFAYRIKPKSINVIISKSK